MNVILFDIDGTLIRSGGAGKAAMEDALRSEFGIREIRDCVPYSGRTDPAISRDLLRTHGLDASEPNVQRLKAAYLERLPQSLRRHEGVVLPGIREILSRLHGAQSIVVGLLTGNVRDGACCKLSHFGLWQHFSFGGFGDGNDDRNDVARGALLAMVQHLGRQVNPRNIWVIGDTPLDVLCARAIGAHAIAVATGWDSIDELAQAGADCVLPDLSDPAALFDQWGLVKS
jgi:phosphoglycolate phosphatase